MNYNDLLIFSRNMIERVLLPMRYDLLNEHDFVCEAIATGAKDTAEIKTHIVGFIYKEKYRKIGEIQQIEGFQPEHKVCKGCNQCKASCEFRVNFDGRYGMRYLDYRCKECRRKYQNSPEAKAKRRAYNSDETRRAKARERTKKRYREDPEYRRKTIERATQYNKNKTR